MSEQVPIRRRTALGLILAALPFTAAADIFEDARSLLPGAGHRLKMAWWGSSTMAGVSPELESIARTYRMRFFNGGVGGQTAEQILARLGSRPALMTGGTIPASGPAVLTTPSMSAAVPAPFKATGTLAGVPGTLTKAHGTQAGYTFARDQPGKPVRIPDGEPFIPTKGKEFRRGINHLNIGKNNLTGKRPGTSDPDTILGWTFDAYDWLTASSPRVLVWGHFVNTGTPEASAVRGKIRRINEALKDRYGPRYVDVEGLLTHLGVWEAAGVQPTAADLKQQALGNKPPSLSLNPAHMNATGYKAVRHVIEQRLGELAWLPPGTEKPGL